MNCARLTMTLVCLGAMSAAAPSHAGNGDELTLMTRFRNRVVYSDPQRMNFDCQMSWQPLRSAMHPNMLPPGMRRPIPLPRTIPSLLPRLPRRWNDTRDWTGCNGMCYNDGRWLFPDRWNNPGH